VACLPIANASVIYIDVDALRRSGILNMLVGSKTAEEPDYRQFVQETGFDYRQDLDAVAAALKDGRIYFALRGRFHWNNLRDYAARQNGSCHNDFCVVAGSQPNRRISFYPLKSGVMAMAIGPDDFGAYQVTNQSTKLSLDVPKAPVWALIPAASLHSVLSPQSMDTLPAAAKAYVPALQGADQIVFSMGANSARQLQLDLQVTCKDMASASALFGCAPAPEARSSRPEHSADGRKFSPRRPASLRLLAHSAGLSGPGCREHLPEMTRVPELL
jgi:hypothetical protein